MRVLIAGVGYRNLRDHSFGPLLVDGLGAGRWPPDISVEDVSYNPIAVVQRLEDDPPERRFDLAIVAGAMERGRPNGTLDVYRWDKALPAPPVVQRSVAEAVTGVIALDNTLIIAGHFAALPPVVVVIEVEPAVHAFGDELSVPVAYALERAAAMATSLALDPRSAALLAEAPLGGGWPAHPRAATEVSDVRFRLR